MILGGGARPRGHKGPWEATAGEQAWGSPRDGCPGLRGSVSLSTPQPSQL